MSIPIVDSLSIFVLSCGEDEWTFAETIQIGQPSMAQATVELFERSQLFATFGYGDPESPVWEALLAQEIMDAGTHTLSLDVTDQFAALPPAAGEERWFLNVESSSVATIWSFNIGYGATVVGTQDTEVALPDFPVTIKYRHLPSFKYCR